MIKVFITVLDFIGNHNKTFLISIALRGGRYYDKDSLKVSVATDFSDIPGCSNIQMDRIAQKRILEQLNTENFNSLKYLKEEYNEFKSLIGGKIPYMLMDHIKYDEVPDQLKFIKYANTYIEFLNKVEKSTYISDVLEDEDFVKILKELSGKLPIKRPHEFILIKYLLSHDEITIVKAKNEMLKYIENVDEETIIHSFKTLNQSFYDSGQIKNNIKMLTYDNHKLFSLLPFIRILKEEKYKNIIKDIINYGL